MSQSLTRGEFPNTSPRINVVGTSGAGKTTLAHELAARLAIPHIELDALHWEPNWTEASNKVMRERVAKAIEADAWCVDGNYHAVRDIVWSRVNAVVWLDFSLKRIMWQLTVRTLRRISTQEELWGGNRERAIQQLGKNSIFLWTLKTYHRRRREFSELLSKPENQHLVVVHLQTPREVREWLAQMPLYSDFQKG